MKRLVLSILLACSIVGIGYSEPIAKLRIPKDGLKLAAFPWQWSGGATFIDYLGTEASISTSITLSDGFFDLSGTTEKIKYTGDLIGTGDVTIYAVIEMNSYGSTYKRIIDNGKFALSVEQLTHKIAIQSDGATNKFSANESILLDALYIICVTRTEDGIANIYINNVISGTTDQSSGTPVSGGDTYLFNRAAGDRGFDGKGGNILVFSGIHTAAQRTTMYNTLRMGGLE